MILLALAAQASAVEAERAFAADAQAIGQWTAFRKWAAPEAVMFFPQPASVQARLKDAKDPPQAVQWQPAQSYVSCDGAVAVNTGPWTQPDGSIGYFTTVWRRQVDGGWKWVVDGGDSLSTPRPAVATPKVRVASCTGAPVAGHVPVTGAGEGAGAAPDATLMWHWTVDSTGARRFTASLWNGRGYDVVIDDRVAAPKVAR